MVKMIMNEQSRIEYIECFPALPSRRSKPEWKRLAKQYAKTVFDESITGTDLPLCKIYPMENKTTGGYKGNVFFLPSYVGIPAKKAFGEALTCLGGVLGMLTAGIDMKNGSHDFVEMAKAYYSTLNGHGLVTNNVTVGDGDTCGSFWYDIFPSILYYHITSFYPEDADFKLHLYNIAKTWGYVAKKMENDWEHTGFSLKRDAKSDSNHWIEPDAVVGIAYLSYIGYSLTGDESLLQNAVMCMEQAQQIKYNPYYEILGSYGPYIAARMNAETGSHYDIPKMLQMVFSATSAVRMGWGIIGEKWGDYDAYGLSGSTTDTDGYAFSMNTYVTAAVVAPVVRYAAKYADAIGKYLLHVNHNARLFFADGLPSGMQNNYDWVQETGINCISYEGVRNHGKTTPYGTGDAYKNFNPYGAWGVGLMAAMFEETKAPELICVNISKIEYHAPASHPTYLLYNGAETANTVLLALPEGRFDLYDSCTHSFVQKAAGGSEEVQVPANRAVVLVLIPSGTALEKKNGCLYAGGIAVDYAADGWTAEDMIADIHRDMAVTSTASASSCLSEEYAAHHSSDSDWRGGWLTRENPQDEWLLLDLGETKICNMINIYWHYKDIAYAAKKYKLVISDTGEDWRTVYKTDNNTVFYNNNKLNDLKCRYVKVLMVDKDNRELPYGIDVIQVFGRTADGH